MRPGVRRERNREILPGATLLTAFHGIEPFEEAVIAPCDGRRRGASLAL